MDNEEKIVLTEEQELLRARREAREAKANPQKKKCKCGGTGNCKNRKKKEAEETMPPDLSQGREDLGLRGK